MSRAAHKLIEAISELAAWIAGPRAPAPVYVYAYYRKHPGAARPPAIRR